MKKGLGLSMNFIILLVIGLVALIIISAIGMGKIRFFQANTEVDCSVRSGICMSGGDCIEKGGSPAPFTKGCEDSEVCCIGECKANGGTCKSSSCSGDELKSIFFCGKSDEVCCVKR